MQIDLRRAVPAVLVTLGATVGLGLVVALLEALTDADLGLLYTGTVLLAGVAGGLTLGRGGGLSRLVAHLGAPLVGGLVGALVVAVVLPRVDMAWGASPTVWLAALEGGLAVWLVRTVDWRSTVRTPASEWRRITGQPAHPVRPTQPPSAGVATAPPSYGAYAPAATPVAPAPADEVPVEAARAPLASAGYLKAVAWGAGAALVLGVLGAVTSLPLGIVGSVVAGAVAAWRVPAVPGSGIGRCVGVAAIASAVGTLVIVLVPGTSALLPAVVLGAAAGALVGLVRRAMV